MSTAIIMMTALCSYFCVHGARGAILEIIHDWESGSLPKASNIAKLFWWTGVYPFAIYKMWCLRTEDEE